MCADAVMGATVNVTASELLEFPQSSTIEPIKLRAKLPELIILVFKSNRKTVLDFLFKTPQSKLETLVTVLPDNKKIGRLNGIALDRFIEMHQNIVVSASNGRYELEGWRCRIE